MSKIIIGIHGLGNKPSKKTLEKWWINSITEGLERINKKGIKFKFELIYWADVLNGKPLDETIVDKEDPYYLQEKYNPAPYNFHPKPHPYRKKILGFLEKQLDKILLNKDLSPKYSFISEVIIHKYFKELEIYYTGERFDANNIKCTVKSLIRNKAAEVLEKYEDDDIMLVAHSMGSIVAYDVLTFILPELDIETFVTMGSPLGLPIIMSKIAAEQAINQQVTEKLTTPPGIKRSWFNFSDLEDKIAMNYNLGDDYNENPNGVRATDLIVNNDYEINGVRNPHKSYGYLRVPEFAKVIYDFIEKKESKTGLWVYDYPKNIYERFNKILKSGKDKINSVIRK